MSTCVLELNDTGIRVFSDNRLLYESPGYALVDGKQVITGKQAQSLARLSPRKINTRFWSQLSLDSLNMHSPRVQHTADLAWLHLAEIQSAIQAECNELIFALPGTFSKQQLGLLLGIAQECSIMVTGLVDSALAAVASLETKQKSVILDIHLHRIVLTHVTADADLRRGEVEVLANSGLVSLHEVWAEAISDLFVRHTRFDPMHRAQTEQALYDSMPAWLARLDREAVIDIEIDAGRRSHSVSLPQEALVKAASEYYKRVTDGVLLSLGSDTSIQLLLTNRICRLPGFIRYLQNKLPDIQIIKLNEDSVSQGVSLYESQIHQSGESLHYVSRLEFLSRKSASESLIAKPLYVVHQGHAHALTHGPLEIRCCSQQDNPEQYNLQEINHEQNNHELRIERRVYKESPVPDESDDYCLIHRLDNSVMLEKHGVAKIFVNQEQVFSDTQLRAGDSVYIGECGAALLLIELLD